MGNLYNVYCDESCHLPNDGKPVMLLGAVWCPADKVKEIHGRISEIKRRHGIPVERELKWTKVSPGLQQLYMDLIDYFFDDDDLYFRCLVIHDKAKLDHSLFNQDHDTWYYKMYFLMLKSILEPGSHYRIYIDIKDSRSADKVQKLHDVLCNSLYDFRREIVERIQQIRSHEVGIMQLTDLLLGAASYANRTLTANSAKVALIERIRKRSGYSLLRPTLLRENKVNLFHWKPVQPGVELE
jgi:hypothetical protein